MVFVEVRGVPSLGVQPLEKSTRLEQNLFSDPPKVWFEVQLLDEKIVQLRVLLDYSEARQALLTIQSMFNTVRIRHC